MSSSSSSLSHVETAGSSENPPARWLDMTPDLSLEECFGLIAKLKSKPPGRDDVLLYDQAKMDCLLQFLQSKLPVIKNRTKEKLSKRALADISDDETMAIMAYTAGPPFDLYLLVNASMMKSRGMQEHTELVGPFVKLLVRALHKLDRIKATAARAVRCGTHPMLLDVFTNHSTKLAPGARVNFWGFSSFTSSDKVMRDPSFSGGPTERALIYKCVDMTAVDINPFSVAPGNEQEVMPLPPAVFEVVMTVEVPNVPKLVVVITQKDNSEFQYLTGACAGTEPAAKPAQLQQQQLEVAQKGGSASSPPPQPLPQPDNVAKSLPQHQLAPQQPSNQQQSQHAPAQAQPQQQPAYAVPSPLIPAQQPPAANIALPPAMLPGDLISAFGFQQHQPEQHGQSSMGSPRPSPVHGSAPPPLAVNNSNYNAFQFQHHHHHQHHHHFHQHVQGGMPHLNPNLAVQHQHHMQQQQQQQPQQKQWPNQFPPRTTCTRCNQRRTMKNILICRDCASAMFTNRLLPALQAIGGPLSASPLRFGDKTLPFWELANNYPVQIRDPNEPGRAYPSVEHFYHVAKFKESAPAIAEQVRLTQSAREAFDLARQHVGSVRPDWNSIKDDCMKFALRLKFNSNTHCNNVLRATGQTVLIWHTPHDAWFGNGGDDKGHNKLGSFLMQIRHEIVTQNTTVPASSDDEDANNNSCNSGVGIPVIANGGSPGGVSVVPSASAQQQHVAWQQPHAQSQPTMFNATLPHSAPPFQVMGQQQHHHQQQQQQQQPQQARPGAVHHPQARRCGNANCPCDITDGRFTHCCTTCSRGAACRSRVHVATVQQIAAYPAAIPAAVAASSANGVSVVPTHQDCARTGCPCDAHDPSTGQIFCSKTCAAGTACYGPWHKK